MKIRKIIYSIDYIHILTFRENYKSIIAPYFSYEPLEYAIDNEQTIHESIRLIFRNEAFSFDIRKEGMTMQYEGDIAVVKKSNPIIDMFFEIYEKMRKIDGFTKTRKHRLVIDAVDIKEKGIIEEQLEKPTYLLNPFGKLQEFSAVYQFEVGPVTIKFQFGNYSEKDIKQFSISPFNTEYNQDLKGALGFMSLINLDEETNLSNFSRFKTLLKTGEDVNAKFLNA